MQTFMPYPDFKESAKCLDNKRLGKQRVEAWQIYLSLTKKDYGWKNHPAVKMWKGYEKALLLYGICICQEWIRRGFEDNMRPKFENKYQTIKDIISKLIFGYYNKTIIYSPWFGNKKFHNSHKSNLLRKDKKYYSQFKWKVPDNLPYYWPTKEEKNANKL